MQSKRDQPTIEMGRRSGDSNGPDDPHYRPSAEQNSQQGDQTMNTKPTPRQSKVDGPAAYPDVPPGPSHDGPTLFDLPADGPAAPDVQPAIASLNGDNGGGPSDPPDQVGAVADTPEPEPEPDPFDPARLRLRQNFAASVGVRRVYATIPLRKPSKEWFIRTHPDPDYRLEISLLELKEDRETYQVIPDLWDALTGEPTFGPKLIVMAVNRPGVPFVWPIRLPGPDGKIDNWSRSAHEAANLARTHWVRVRPNMGIQAYDIDLTTARLPEPSWPALTFRQVLDITFRGKRISDLDHPVLRRLRGEV